jgi:hypothetical protein
MVGHGRECCCGPEGFRASVRDRITNGTTWGPTFDTLLEALVWQRDQVASSTGAQSAVARVEVGAVIDDFLLAADAGLTSDSQGQPYGPGSVPSLRGALSYVYAESGRLAVDEVRRHHLQGLVDQLRDAGVDGGRILAVVDALSELYSYAVRRDLVGFSPVVELDLQGSRADPPHDLEQSPLMCTAYDHWPRPVPPAAAEPNGSGPVDLPPSDRSGRPRFPGVGLPSRPPATPTCSSCGFPSGAPAAPGQPSGGFSTPHAAGDRTGSGVFSGPLGARGQAPEATMQERWLRWTVRIIVIVVVLMIALVLVAESV